ncbi:MAG TPA: sialidase family protein [Acidimicrobiales bacterium]|nr:sialidase family protein [Acidimicrobiales bacterium]
MMGLPRAVAALPVVLFVLKPLPVQGEAPPLPRVHEELPATANTLVAPLAQNSPMLVADPRDSRLVVLANRVDAPTFGCALQVSGDGGRHWVPANPVPKLPAGADTCYAPEVAFDAEGVLYYLFVGLAGEGNEPMGVFIATSADHGRNFGTPKKVLGPRNFMVRMAIDQSSGRLHLVWLHATGDPGTGSLPPPPNPILAAHSDDGGRTFNKPVQVSDASRKLVVAPAVALGPDRALHVLYYDLGEDLVDYHGLEGPTWDGKWSLVVANSRDGGRRFSRGTVVDDGVVPPERVMLIFTMPPPALVADQSGRLFAAWHDARNGDWDVFMRSSGDVGRSWSRPRRLNDDGLGSGRHQYQPRLSTSSNGRVDAVFYDRRNDARNVANDVYLTSSSDEGRTFGPNVKVTTKSSNSLFGQRYLGAAATGMVEFGARLGLLSREGEAVAAWTDTRNGYAPPYQDIFTAAVELKRPSKDDFAIGAPQFAGAVVLAGIGWLGYRRWRRRPAPITASERGRAGDAIV